VDDFDDFDGLFSDDDRADLAGDIGDADPFDGADGLSLDDWREAFGPYVDDGSITPEALDNLWEALADWEESADWGDGFEIIADFDVDAGEGNYL
jgi:hypothetical protein